MSSKKLKITAVISARNDWAYLQHTLPYLFDQSIFVHLIDQASTDGTPDHVRGYVKNKDMSFEQVSYAGHFDLTDQLETKAKAIAGLQADWVIHQDADEILQTRQSFGNLRAAIEDAHLEGATLINFDELVMLPVDPTVDDILTNNRNCYFFEPRPQRLMRAWNKSKTFSNVATGGHQVEGEGIKLYSQNLVLKHFIVRSQDHALSKYANRIFSPEDLAKGWHGNRKGLAAAQLHIPQTHANLIVLDTVKDIPNPWPNPIKSHFWHW